MFRIPLGLPCIGQQVHPLTTSPPPLSCISTPTHHPHGVRMGDSMASPVVETKYLRTSGLCMQKISQQQKRKVLHWKTPRLCYGEKKLVCLRKSNKKQCSFSAVKYSIISSVISIERSDFFFRTSQMKWYVKRKPEEWPPCLPTS